MAKHFINPEYNAWSAKQDVSARQTLTKEKANALRQRQREARFNTYSKFY